MQNTSKTSVQLLLTCLLFNVVAVHSKEGFIATFQNGIDNSDLHAIDHWMEYTSPIPRFKDFTSCQWIKIKYFSNGFMPIWSYCMIRKRSENMECLQIGLNTVSSSADRNFKTEGLLPWSRAAGSFFYPIEVELKPFLHRTWIHMCWTYTSSTGANEIYYNGEALKRVYSNYKEGRRKIIEGTRDVKAHAFIIGQEQDSLRSGFTQNNILNGQLTELNVWDYVLTDTFIRSMSLCENFPKGNVISWNKENFRINKAKVTTVDDPTSLCTNERNLVIFPEKRTLKAAKNICAIHGGKLGVPQSEEENQEFIEMLLNHKEGCKNTNIGTSAWIGLKSNDSKWYETNNNDSLGRVARYTNFAKNDVYINGYRCAYLPIKGEWQGGKWECREEKLCAICSIENTPVFTLKGMCENISMDANYYIISNDNKSLNVYEGYRSTNLVKKEDNKWTVIAKHGTLGAFAEISTTNARRYPIGRLEWDVYEPSCYITQRQKKILTFSMCRFGTEFTCDSGHCVDLHKRCNKVVDCLDRSDEENCTLISIPETYDKRKPYELRGTESEPTEVKTKVNVFKNTNLIGTLLLSCNNLASLHLFTCFLLYLFYMLWLGENYRH